MSKGAITFHDITRPMFEAVQKRLLTDLGGELLDGSDTELRCLGIHGALRYDEKSRSASVDIRYLPSVLSRSAVIGWLHDALTGELPRDPRQGGLYWDVLTVNLHNNTNLTLTVTDVPNLDHGIYLDYPADVAPGAHWELFRVSSASAAEIGPQGSVAFGLADGTSLNVNFDMEFAVGQVSTLTAATSGPSNTNYDLTARGSHTPWRGQGTSWEVLLVLDPTPGATFAENSYTR